MAAEVAPVGQHPSERFRQHQDLRAAGFPQQRSEQAGIGLGSLACTYFDVQEEAVSEADGSNGPLVDINRSTGEQRVRLASGAID
jgi:hypothetical protein